MRLLRGLAHVYARQIKILKGGFGADLGGTSRVKLHCMYVYVLDVYVYTLIYAKCLFLDGVE